VSSKLKKAYGKGPFYNKMCQLANVVPDKELQKRDIALNMKQQYMSEVQEVLKRNIKTKIKTDL